jgi:hypothetical protein
MIGMNIMVDKIQTHVIREKISLQNYILNAVKTKQHCANTSKEQQTTGGPTT